METNGEIDENALARFDKELIDWDADQLKAQSSNVDAKHGKVKSVFRKSIPPTKICSLFCGGKKCKFDNATYWKPEQMEVDGLFSNWVTENILAMARPNTVNMEKYKIINQFRILGITSIINLQLPGEHAGCGHGLEESGFSYSPQQFMDNGVFFYNFGWEDFGVGSLSGILDMVKVMQFALSEGKVAVHCHAGLGRTGALIACYLVFANKITAKEAIQYVRSKRLGAIQTQGQVDFVKEFVHYLTPLRIVFNSIDNINTTPDMTLAQFLLRQRHLLHGYEARALKNIPKILFVCSERLLQLAKKGPGYKPSIGHGSYKAIKLAQSHIDPPLSARASQSEGLHTVASKLSLEDSLDSQDSLVAKRSASMGNFHELEMSGLTSKHSDTSLGSSCSGLDFPVYPSDSSETASVAEFSQVHGAHFVEVIGQCLSEHSYSEQTQAAVLSIKTKVNEDNSYFNVLAHEKDPLVLSALMWNWLDHLKEPLLTQQDVRLLTEHTAHPLAALSFLDKGPRMTIEYLSKFIARLEPISETTEQNLLQRMLSTLTHQNIVTEYHSLAAPENAHIKRTVNGVGFMREGQAKKLLVFFSFLINAICKKFLEAAEEAGGEAEGDEPVTGSSEGDRPEHSHVNDSDDVVRTEGGKPKKRGR